MTRQGIMPTIERMRTELEKYPSNILKNAANVAQAILLERERQDHLDTFRKAVDAYRKYKSLNNIFFVALLVYDLDNPEIYRQAKKIPDTLIFDNLDEELCGLYEMWFRGDIVLKRKQVDYVNKYNLLGKASKKIQEKLGYDEFDIYQGKFVRASLG